MSTFRVLHSFNGTKDGKLHTFYNSTIIILTDEEAALPLASRWVEKIEGREIKVVIPQETKQKRPILKLNIKE